MSDDKITEVLRLSVKHRLQLNDMRYDGKRWVDATRPDRPLLEIIPQVDPGKDMFGGSGIRRPSREPALTAKSRRRGGF